VSGSRSTEARRRFASQTARRNRETDTRAVGREVRNVGKGKNMKKEKKKPKQKK
jgi:hypothetical protein